MKTKLLTLSLLLLGISLSIHSCKKDKDDPADVQFAFTLKTGPGYITSDATLASGEQFKVGIDAVAATGFSLNRFTVVRIFNSKPDTVFDTVFSISTFTIDYHGIALSKPGQEEWVFTMNQNDSRSIIHDFLITTENVVGPIYSYDTRILGAQINGTGSSFSSSDGMIYSLPEAKNNAQKVDLLYLFLLTESAVLASPDAEEAALVFTDGGTYENPGPNALITWPVRNSTRFRKILDPIDWDAIQDDALLITYTQGSIDRLVTSLEIGNFISFITYTGKKGLIRVNGISGEEDGTINISVKVQQ